MLFSYDDYVGKNVTVHLVENYGAVANPYYEDTNPALLYEIGLLSGKLLAQYDNGLLIEVQKDEGTKSIFIYNTSIKMVEL